MSIEFTQKWIEDAVRGALGDSADLARIKYLAIGESFDNDFFIDLSRETPPKPFVNTDGGDEWICCLRNGDIAKLVEKYRGKTNIQMSCFGIDRPDDADWRNYCFSDEAKEKWNKFRESISDALYYEELPDDEFERWYYGVTENTWRDVAEFTGAEVLRVHGLEFPDFKFLENFHNLRAVEFVETVFTSAEGIENLLKLEQLSCWMD